MTALPAVLKVLLIAGACGLALMVTNWLTADRIRFNETLSLRQAVSTLVPGADLDRTRMPDLDRIPGLWRLCTGELLGRSAVEGYAGPIQLLYTLDQDGRLIRLRVQRHQETPGITDFLDEPDWLARFHNRNAGELRAIATITGATITTRAIIEHLPVIATTPEEILGPVTDLSCES